ncbi:(2Fe-2S)-binding protein [Actinoplanes sp. GCM10030250]|uniref:(2Fe-2S)-binding protein n=1 Tax=Actinoplanes sp. GCM10030250 TaxID=3273376 RepID=UPI003623CF7F
MSGHVRVTLTINGTPRDLEVEPHRPLADALRDDCGLHSVHLGCTDGTCGACTVIVDGDAVRSCLMLAVQCQSAQVRTVEGLAPDHPLRAAIPAPGAARCGFCVPGYVMLAAAALEQDPAMAADPERLNGLLACNVCWCGAGDTTRQEVIRSLRQPGGRPGMIMG